MSVVICYCCEGFSMIATDTRICYEKTIGEYTDNNKKLQVANKGFSWAAGAGAVGLIDSFIDLTNKVELNSYEDINKLFKMALNITKIRFDYTEDTLENTGVVISMNKPNIQQLFQIYLWSYKIGNLEEDSIVEINRNEFYLLYPPNFDDQGKRNKFKEDYLNCQIDNDIDFITKHTCKIFKYICDCSETVSNIIDFGITYLDQELDIVRLQLRVPVTELLELESIFQHPNTQIVWRLSENHNKDRKKQE